jgi:hypothetical protein
MHVSRNEKIGLARASNYELQVTTRWEDLFGVSDSLQLCQV